MTLVWGIDPSTVRVSVAAAEKETEELLWARTLSLPQHDDQLLIGRELAEQMRAQQEWFAELCMVRKPELIAIEQPFAGGKLRKVPLPSYFALGVTMAALAASVSAVVPIVRLGPSSWKKRALGAGHGGAEKAEIMAWAHERGMTGIRLQDEADACGLAVAATTVRPVRS